MDVVTAFRRSVERAADRPFACDAERCVSYAEADERSDAIATALVSAGVASEEPVGPCAPDCVELILAIIGVTPTCATPPWSTAPSGSRASSSLAPVARSRRTS